MNGLVRAKELPDSLGNPSATFHEHQWEAISTLVEQRARLLVVQRTGWGKSSLLYSHQAYERAGLWPYHHHFALTGVDA